ncbi:MAG: 23S rRNA (adenine(2030)-N(6))-methyltransferase RlmJ [Lautropia sp.]|nr:23S rRNA (adenine(2030)-N(6))-methyltransferase RlmJ [Lautropia sp.]
MRRQQAKQQREARAAGRDQSARLAAGAPAEDDPSADEGSVSAAAAAAGGAGRHETGRLTADEARARGSEPGRRRDGASADVPEPKGWTPGCRRPLAYPGSPWLALQQMRRQDRLRCFEAHPTEVRVLQQALAPAGRQAQVFGEDGFDGLKALLPPVSRRGVVVIDPSYEDKRDYARARRTLIEALERFATGTMLLWYPLVRRREAMLLMEHLTKIPGATDWLDVRMQVCAQPEDGHGLYGSGVYVINPPYTLEAALGEAMPVLTRLLGQDDQAGWFMQTSADVPPRPVARPAVDRSEYDLPSSQFDGASRPGTGAGSRGGRSGRGGEPGAARQGAGARTGGAGRRQAPDAHAGKGRTARSGKAAGQMSQERPARGEGRAVPGRAAPGRGPRSR